MNIDMGNVLKKIILIHEEPYRVKKFQNVLSIYCITVQHDITVKWSFEESSNAFML